MPTALIVEDEPEANQLLAMLVRIKGYHPESALTGNDALAILRTQRPDVVFLDLMLPDTDGFEICRKIKADPRTSLVPVIVVTAWLPEDSRIQSYQLGAHGFVPKPYTPDQIFQALASADTWNHELAGHGGSGEIPINAGEEDFARGISRLRGLLLARTPLSDESTDHIICALRAIRDDTRDFARHHRVEQVASASYTLQDDRLTLSIRDMAGWFSKDTSTPVSARLEPKLNQAFDESDTLDCGREAILTKHFASRASDPGSL